MDLEVREKCYNINGDYPLGRMRHLERTCLKLAKAINHCNFLRRCLKRNIIPKGLRVKLPFEGKKISELKTRMERSLVRERLRYWNGRRHTLAKETNRAKEWMFGKLAAHDAEKNWRMVVARKEVEFQRTKAGHIKKFDSLVKELTVRDERTQSDFRDCVVNLSSVTLGDSEVSLLSKGLKFVPTPRRVPIKDVITGVEQVASELGEREAEELRHEAKRILRKAKVPRSNLSNEEVRAIRSLKAKDDAIIILQADKGNKTVVMDRVDYEVKLTEALEKQNVERIKKDLTDCENRKVVKVLKKIEDQGELTRVERLRLTVNAPKCPVVYGMPKIHKEGAPLRLIFSFCDSPTYLISRFMARILQPLHGNTRSYVRDSTQICEVIGDLSLGEDDVLVSYDVVNLFGSVPAMEAARMALSRLESDEGLKERTGLGLPSCDLLLETCIKSNYFKCKGAFYKTSTCPIGSPLSPALCSIFMEEFEERALRESNVVVKLWKRYVDDSLAVIKKGEEELLLKHLNSGHDDIQFTYESENDGRIPFLDIELLKEQDGVRTRVFRKKTSTDRYLDFQSAHSRHIKWGIVSCLRERAERVCNRPEDVEKEKEAIRRVFVKNGYPGREVKRRLAGRRRRRKETETLERERQAVLRIPFVPGMEKDFERLARKLKVKLRYMRGRSLGNMVSKAKLDKVEVLERGGVIYGQKCGECDEMYIGETARRAKERKKEHERDVKQVSMRSAISEHCHSNNHRPDFNSFEILDVEKNWKRRKIKESLYIMANKTFNRDGGIGVDRRWKFLVKDEK